MGVKAEERKKEILRVISNKKKLTVEELEKIFGVSGVTLRKDLEDLENENYLYRVYGGAVINEKVGYEFPILERLNDNIPEKKSIAKEAISLIKEKEAIFLDSGTTVFELARLLKSYENLTVVTNSYLAISELITSKRIHLICLGGEFNPDHLAFCGLMTIKELRQFHFDKAFLGTDGFSLESGLMTNDVAIAEIEKVALNNADKKIVLADHTKIGKNSFVTTIETLKAIDLLVTDWKVNKKTLKELQEKVSVVVSQHQE